MIRTILLAALAVSPGVAQRIFVYSPMTRIDPFGLIVKADRGTNQPRTILSPGIPRNASTPLRLVVEMDKPEFYYLDIGQNPDNAVKATLYKELFVETPAGQIPDSLQEVSIPYRGTPADFAAAGRKVVSFWLDMGVAKDAEVDRIKIEPQLYVDSLKDWVIYPMEVRIQSPVVPARPPLPAEALPATTAPSDTAAYWPLRVFLCGATSKSTAAEPKEPATAREMLRRYVWQDLGLVKDKAKLTAALARATGRADVKAWCDSPATPATGPEWYLELRDAIYREAGAQ